jgi:hypothetical protein
MLQTLLRLLLSILRGPLSADEAAAAAGGEDGGAGAGSSSMEGVQQQPSGLRPLVEGPVIDLGEWLLLLGCPAARLVSCCCQSATFRTQAGTIALVLLLTQLHLFPRRSGRCRPGAGTRGAHRAPAGVQAGP